MRIQTTALLVLTSTLLSSLAGAQSDAEWLIGARVLSPPQHASPELAQVIANGGQPDMDVSGRYPDSDEAWLALQARARSGDGPLPALAEALDLTIESSQLASSDGESITLYSITPANIAPEHQDHVFLHLHGGGYVLGGGPGAASEATRISAAAGIRTVSVDYRMPPQFPFPAAVDDAIAAYRSLLADYEPGSIAIGGTSAGAGLSFAAVLQMKNLGLPLPGAIFAGTPWADLTDSSDSLHTNAGIDRILITYEGLLQIGAEQYAAGEDLTNPLISPLYGDFSDFPPTILISGTRDMLLSDTARAHRKLLAAGAVADLHVFEGMSHAEYMIMPELPESQMTFAEISRFLKTHLD